MIGISIRPPRLNSQRLSWSGLARARLAVSKRVHRAARLTYWTIRHRSIGLARWICAYEGL
jgi:hypothetical protein